MITIPITPVPKPRMTQSDRWKKRPAVVRYHEFCDELRLKWRDRTVPPTFWIFFHMPMPQSWSELKKIKMNGEPHQQRPDIDNLLKAFLDCLCEDDSYVYDVRAAKFWSSDPRIEVMSL